MTVTSLRRNSIRDDHIYCMKSDGINWNLGNLTLTSKSGSSGKARLVCVFSVGSRQGAKITAVKNISADTWRRSRSRWSASLMKNGISTQIRPIRPTVISNQPLKRTLETRQRYSLRVRVSGKDPCERDDVAAEWDYIRGPPLIGRRERPVREARITLHSYTATLEEESNGAHWSAARISSSKHLDDEHENKPGMDWCLFSIPANHVVENAKIEIFTTIFPD